MTKRERGLLKAVEGSLMFLKKAVKADYPKEQILVRIHDIRQVISELIVKGG